MGPSATGVVGAQEAGRRGNLRSRGPRLGRLVGRALSLQDTQPGCAGSQALSSLSRPYNVIEAFPQLSNYKLELTAGDSAHPLFHASTHTTYTLDSPNSSSRNSLPDLNRSMLKAKRSLSWNRLSTRGEGSHEAVPCQVAGVCGPENTWEPGLNVEDTEASHARNWMRERCERGGEI